MSISMNIIINYPRWIMIPQADAVNLKKYVLALDARHYQYDEDEISTACLLVGICRTCGSSGQSCIDKYSVTMTPITKNTGFAFF